MFSVGTERELAKVLFYMTKVHGFQPSELLAMTYTDLKINIALLEQYLQEEEDRYNRMKQGFG